MPEPRLHLDADASSKALHEALVERDHDVTRTPTDWMERDASDERQLLGATAHGRCIQGMFRATKRLQKLFPVLQPMT